MDGYVESKTFKVKHKNLFALTRNITINVGFMIAVKHKFTQCMSLYISMSRNSTNLKEAKSLTELENSLLQCCTHI